MLVTQIDEGNTLVSRLRRLRESYEEAQFEDAKNDYKEWDSLNIQLLKKLFDDKNLIADYKAERKGSAIPYVFANQYVDEIWGSVKGQVRYLGYIKKCLALIEDVVEQPLAKSEKQDKPVGNSVFVVHGHDEVVKLKVVSFLKSIGLEPTILHEKPNQSRTIIEKFEDYSDVSYAVILLTPDDTGGSQGKAHQPRARQNVIFEMGFFFGKLGRGRVCALRKGETEKPTDMDGILYIPFDDNDGWQMKLAKDLKAAKLPIDPSKLLGELG
ncbi:MAG: nucleotide-binding protein [Dehalococcoidia bacterium]|nr:nucleotide-binding protein [Dehalococcoidia bacterium]